MKRLYRVQLSFDVVALLDDHIEDCDESKSISLKTVLEQIIPEFDGGAEPTKQRTTEIRSVRGLPNGWDGSESPFGEETRSTISELIDQIKREEKNG